LGLSLAAFASAVAAVSAANGSVAYSYDPLGRVLTASYDTGVCIIYAYDPNGNRTSEVISIGTASIAVWGTGVWGCFNWAP
jgi:YD repeat-containing protein